ncbi:hypothetical protein PFICI_03687 [Pestalotiopsis fici W106-1]|uniref:F-box domain-containing protein n=1 Tax=Pestalotiopsis fici (strain W106-1 / CGMCC3.15140) TaxID=1229662 RepID=W3XJM0_PESFW|nr:uncharacterized protein PFICI_03687 [Pestalotiopsis fici W106-1]ETS85662.1 hypothetical protein PFICI_03687 [Pestalotiopsis fici W106-1]
MDFREPLKSPLLKSRPGSSRKRESFKEKNNIVIRKSWDNDTGLNTITPTSGLDLLIRHALARSNTPAYFDEHGNPVLPPASPLRRSMQPLENIADRMRQKRKSWYDGQDEDDEDGGEQGKGVVPSRLLALPTELQFLVISHLELSDLERLRRTCQYYRFLLSPEYVRALFGGRRKLAWHMTGHCQECLESPGRDKLILQIAPPPRASNNNRDTTNTIINDNNITINDNNSIMDDNNIIDDNDGNLRPPISRREIYLPSSKCFTCSVRDRDLKIGVQYQLADGEGLGAWACRWCGWPVAFPSSRYQFHIACYDRYYKVLWRFMYLGFAQLTVGIVAAALSLVYFRRELVVFVPTVINFVLLWICLTFLVFRGNRIRTYHWVGILELIIMSLWIPPIYTVSQDLKRNTSGKTFASSIAVLTFAAINMLFRLLNVIGNVFLMLHYDMTRHYVPEMTIKDRLLNFIMTGLIFWTYPQSVEQRYPPHFH